MLSILDRYVFRSLVYSYAVCALALLGITMILDAFLRVGDFMKAAHAPATPGFGVMSVMIQYYTVRIPVFFQLVSPAIMLTSAMFCMAQLNKNNELVPMRASGISLYRTLAPVFLLAFAVTALLMVNQEVVIPSLVGRLKATESIIEAGQNSVLEKLDLEDDQMNGWDIPKFIRGEDKMLGTILVESRDPKSPYAKVYLTAESAKWKRTASDGVPRWHLSNGTETRHDAAGRRITSDEANYNSHFGEDGYVILRPEDKRDDPFHLVSNFTPGDIIPADKALPYQSSAYLRRVYASDPSRRDIGILIQNRWAFPLSNVVLLLLGLPFVLGSESKSTFGGLIICIVICSAFYGIHALCTELGKETLSPPAAAWLPIALFAPLGIFLFDGVKT